MIKEYELTDEQLNRLYEAAKPVPMIMLQCGTTRSTQERANAVWAAIGEEIGFIWDTVKPSNKGVKFFVAETKP